MKTFKISENVKEVSRVGLGCMRLTQRKTDDEVRAIVDTALENGINFFDHADIYAGGEAEAAFGKILTPFPSGNRWCSRPNVPSVRESTLIFQKSTF